MAEYFEGVSKIKYEGKDSTNDLSFKYYNPDQIVMGKTMAEHLRFAAAYWHTFSWPGGDPFGGQTLMRPWMAGGDPMQEAELKLEVAFEFFTKLGTPYYCFHDRDVSPEGDTLAETMKNLDYLGDKLLAKQEETGVKLLWGTANMFSHRRYMSGAASNPDPDVVTYCAAQVRQVFNLTQKLGGENYVLWGGREGYETLLNTDWSKENAQMGRFLNMVVEHKHKIGFKGAILIEPKPQEPTKHQYDYDAQSVHAFLQQHGLENEVKLNLEANHATLAGHSFEHEITYAASNGLLGSIDMNRGDMQSGWDTDQFPNNVPDTTLAMYAILKNGGLGTGGINFDAKVRRQSLDPVDLFHGHIGGMDVCARALLNASAMLEDGSMQGAIDDRYAGWDGDLGKKILAGKLSLDDLADIAEEKQIDPQPRSGKQEWYENLVNRFV
ncbi:MAG: xylose isomerase [Alphaproteobacteria bacterium]|nr:xylose isomerase [Alphaproteobacteria bacterium]